MSLKGKVAVVTGASRGIGRALALGLAKEGATVVATARTLTPGSGSNKGSLEETVRQITDSGGLAVPIACDVASEAEIRALVDRTLMDAGPVDILVNNAGELRLGLLTEFDAIDFDAVMAVNVRGPFLACRGFLPGMMERKSGSIVNISSRVASMVTTESWAYGASKAALNRLTVNLAEEVRPDGIAVNGLCPGVIRTSMTDKLSRSIDDSKVDPDDSGVELEMPEVVVPAALWLAQQDASTFTGNVVYREDFGKSWGV